MSRGADCFGPEGCPAFASNGRRCGETRNLQIIKEFKRLYEMKLRQIDDAAGGDCVQAKISLQQEWIRDLTDQNEMLVKVVEELEMEAAERVTMLEEKLEQSAKCACEVMGAYNDFSTNFLADFQRMARVQSDLNNLIELVKRARHLGMWSLKGLDFYTFNVADLLKCDEVKMPLNQPNKIESEDTNCSCYSDNSTSKIPRTVRAYFENEQISKEKEIKIKELEEKIRNLAESSESNEEAKRIYSQYQDLKKSMIETRNALTAEVAEKHECILSLRREVRVLEEQRRKTEQQSGLKDDIIKELRKEVKHMKVQMKEFEEYERKHRDSLESLSSLRVELERYKEEHRGSLSQVETLCSENRCQAGTISCLQEQLRKSCERPPTTSTGTSAIIQLKDAGVDPCCACTRNIGVSQTPEMRNAFAGSDGSESQIIPFFGAPFHHSTPKPLRSIACETEPQFSDDHRISPTVCDEVSYRDPREDYEHVVAVKPPILKKTRAVEMVEALRAATYSCDATTCDALDPPTQKRFTAAPDEDKLREMVILEITEGEEDVGKESSRYPRGRSRDSSASYDHNRAQMLYDGKQAYRTNSNDSTNSDLYTTAVQNKSRRSSRDDPNSDYTRRKRNEEIQCGRGELVELYSPKRKPESRSRSTSPSSSNRGSPAEDLQSVVQDLNESVSRIIEKSPNDKATREKIAKLEAQLRAVNTHLTSMRTDSNVALPSDGNPPNPVPIVDLQALSQKERDVDSERARRNQEVENLKLTIREMEKGMKRKEENAANLQGAVDLYLNSIEVLECSEGRYKDEVAQQRVTIGNLQEVLVATKQQLDELKEKYDRDLEEKFLLLNILDVGLRDLEKQCFHYYNQYLNSLATVEFLRDEILETEVEKFDLTQDAVLFEARLLKYQELSKQYECICGLKKEIKKLHAEISLFKGEVENLQSYIRKCHLEIDSTKTILGKYLGSECSEYCIKQNESVVTLAQDTICYTEDLQCQIVVLETALKREQKINVVQATRIEELQGIIGAKNLELNRAADAYQDAKTKLDASIGRSKSLEDAIKDLQVQLNEMEMEHIYREEKTDICHGELDMCLNNLQSVKLKLRNQCKAMAEKMQELAAVQADCKIHANNAEVLKRDLENTRIRYRDEIIELKHNIRELKEKLANTEDKIDNLNKEVKHSQGLLVDASHRETKIKQDFLAREKLLTDKIHSAQEEEMRLLDVVTQLEQEIAIAKEELDARDAELQMIKDTVVQMNADSLTKQQLSQEEANRLKNEINSLIQQQGAHKVEYERLQKQLESAKCAVYQHEAEKKSLRQQLDKCLEDLKNVEQDKHYLEQRNGTLMGMMDKMQSTLQNKSENLASMEMELMEAKTSRDEICNESRNVVFNVRAWLDEQKKINEELKEKLRRKDALIVKFEQEKRQLTRCNPTRCDPTRCPERATCPRQRGGTLHSNYFDNNVPLSQSPWSLDSRGSGSESPGSSASSAAADWYEYETGYDAIIEEEPTPEIWIHRVESMTEELQRSNRYWKRKINDGEFMVTTDK